MEKIFVYDRDGNLVNDPDKSVDYATGLNWSSYWPKGYGDINFVVGRDIARAWAVKAAYEVIIRDGVTIVFQGILDAPSKSLKGLREDVTLHGAGYYSLLAQRRIRKRWIDNSATTRFIIPEDELLSNKMPINFSEAYILFNGGPDNDNSVLRKNGEEHRIVYTLPTNGIIRRVACDVTIRTGEGYKFRLYNTDQAATEYEFDVASSTDVTTAVDHTFTQGDTNTFEIRVIITVSGRADYRADDFLQVESLYIYTELESGDTPTYSNTELIEDAVAIVATGELSADTTKYDESGYTVQAFVTKDDGFETTDSIVQRLAAFGDGTGETWGASVWDKTYSSDDLPIVEFKQKLPPTDYEWSASLADLSEFADEETLDELYNWIIVKYEDDTGLTVYLSPNNNAVLQDSTSIAKYGRRDNEIDIGQASATGALVLGQRYLSYHKDPLRKTSFGLIGYVKNKQGIPIPANRVRAGQRIKITDYNGGEVFFIRKASYDAESKYLKMEPELPPDDITEK